MKLHLGCGPVKLAGWNNIDLDSPAADLHWDLTTPLPFPDESIDAIYSEHFIEHITREDAVAFLARCRRLLKPGATMRVTTPDLRWIVAMYIAGEVDHWRDVQWVADTPCRLMNEGMRLWGHQWAYDSADLHAVFAEAGFAETRDAAYRESVVPCLAGLESRPYHHELIVEAVKRTVDIGSAGAAQVEGSAARAALAERPVDTGVVAQEMPARSIDAAPDAAALLRDVGELRLKLQAMEASTCWRITAPLRILGGLLRGR
jgi:predicted SAM-dependent methyltransferase